MSEITKEEIEKTKYYILFLACYLHDISMVKIPALDSFLTDTNKADELAKEVLDDFNEEFYQEDSEGQYSLGEDIDILSVKKYMVDSYRKVDAYFEKVVRGRHAPDSAAEIWKRAEIGYLEIPMRALVAEIS